MRTVSLCVCVCVYCFVPTITVSISFLFYVPNLARKLAAVALCIVLLLLRDSPAEGTAEHVITTPDLQNNFQLNASLFTVVCPNEKGQLYLHPKIAKL